MTTRLTLALVALAFARPSRADGPRARSRPNIVYILADDLGYGDVACLNPRGKVPTPNIDRLASEGVTCTDPHSGSSVRTPTRYGLLDPDQRQRPRDLRLRPRPGRPALQHGRAARGEARPLGGRAPGPLLRALAGKIKAGRARGEVICHTDLMATAVRLLSLAA